MRIFCLVVSILFVAARAAVCGAEGAAPEWSINASIIEACSCPMFCQCYFNTSPAGHSEQAAGGHSHGEGGEHYCKFNNAYKVNHGNYGDTKLDGAKFWIAGDLGGDWSKGETDWAVLTFDPSVTPLQREGIETALGHIYPVKWKSFTVANDSAMTWTATKERAEAKLDDGKTAEVVLHKFKGMTDEPIVIKNLRYFSAPRNDGFIMMPNEAEAYRIGDKKFEFKGSNGFMITLEASSKDSADKDKATM